MKRTERRPTLPLTWRKAQALMDLADRFGSEVDAFVGRLLGGDFLRFPSDRALRDGLLGKGYTSPHGLPARMWKMALSRAWDVVSSYWASLAKKVMAYVARGQAEGRFSRGQAKYALWLLSDPRRVQALVTGRCPDPPPRIRLTAAEQRQVRNRLRRAIRRERGSLPAFRSRRVVELDPCMYRVFEHEGHQYIAIQTTERGQRLVLPLKGQASISGNIRLVLTGERLAEVHVTREVRLRPAGERGLPGLTEALDFGITEVATDSEGRRWGEGLGKSLKEMSAWLQEKGEKRGRLRGLVRKYRERGELAKASRIEAENLGRKKWARKRERFRGQLLAIVSQALRAFMRDARPGLLVVEDLSGLRGKFRSPDLSRTVSLWCRHALRERLAQLAWAHGVCLELANPALSSQTCPRCGFVHPGNRRGDTFQCLFCGHGDDADRVGAVNLRARVQDPAIARWTPPGRVREVLTERFLRRLEGWEFDFPPEAATLSVLGGSGFHLTVPGAARETGRTTGGGPRGRHAAAVGGPGEPDRGRQHHPGQSGCETPVDATSPPG